MTAPLSIFQEIKSRLEAIPDVGDVELYRGRHLDLEKAEFPFFQVRPLSEDEDGEHLCGDSTETDWDMKLVVFAGDRNEDPPSKDWNLERADQLRTLVFQALLTDRVLGGAAELIKADLVVWFPEEFQTLDTSIGIQFRIRLTHRTNDPTH